MPKPIIGITCLHADLNLFDETEKFFLSAKRCIEPISANGGVPVLIPSIQECIPEYLARIDGLVFNEGEDISPHMYGERNSASIEPFSPDRDAFEVRLCQCAIAQNLPILGICRGMQLINVAMGGTLIQDIKQSNDRAEEHYQLEAETEMVQIISIERNSKIHDIFHSTSGQINTLHHQAVKTLGQNLKVTAVSSEDQSVEVIEGTQSNWLLGVQWHPEYLYALSPVHNAIFSSFMQAVNERKNGQNESGLR